MFDTKLVSANYAQGNLLDAIVAGMEKLGKTSENIGLEDLAPLDEFHVGGREATQSLLDQIGLEGNDHVLDIGCGIGGAGRFAAKRYGCRVTGIDLTQEYVETGRVLCTWLGLAQRVTLGLGDAMAMPFNADTFQKAWMLHVGMNIADKPALARELYRVVQPGGKVGIYDLMAVGDNELTFPVPWASDPRGSSVASPDAYKEALEKTGFKITAERNRRDFALAFFSQLKAASANAAGPPPLGLHLLMGENASEKYGNMVKAINDNQLTPVELIAEKPA